MIGDIQKTLFDFYKGFGFPVYPQGSVPHNAVLPYFTFKGVIGDTFSQEMAELYFWCDKTKQGNDTLAEVIDRVFESVKGGKVLSVNGTNKLWVQRNGSFAQFGQDIDDKEVQFARVSLVIDFFIN